MERFEEFKEFFTPTALYAELSQQYTSFEIFEVNAGVFEIETVEAAYQRFFKQKSIHQKRGQFSKDLDKLVSGDYVLVPKNPSFDMIVDGLAVIATGVGVQDIEFEVRKVWEKMIEAAQGELS